MERKALCLPCSAFATRLFSVWKGVGRKGLIFRGVWGLIFFLRCVFNMEQCKALNGAALWGCNPQAGSGAHC